MTSEKSYTGWYFLLGVIIIYAITFSGDESVQRGVLNYEHEVATATDTINAVNLSKAMIWNPVLTGRMESNSSLLNDGMESAFQRLNFTDNTS